MADALRKPLYECEKDASPAQVCVTGATGYIAASIVQRLLAAGHTVHSTVRDPSAAHRVAHLTSLPGATDRLKLFKADLQQLGSFDAAIAGCKCVLHTASPVELSKPKKGQERERLIDPALIGIENVLAAVNRTDSVQRVVLTSSVASVVGVHQERGPGHIFTEADWDLEASETHLPYHYGKMLAEKRAAELCASQSRWNLIRILPAVVQGPPLANIRCESVGFMRKLLNGSYWPAVPYIGMGLADVDDVAAAHTLAMVTPAADGRYLCAPNSTSLVDFVNSLRPALGTRYKLALFQAPYAFFWLLSKLTGVPNLEILDATYGPPPVFASGRIERDLGLTWTSQRDMALDMVARMEELGIVKPLSGGGKDGAKL